MNRTSKLIAIVINDDEVDIQSVVDCVSQRVSCAVKLHRALDWKQANLAARKAAEDAHDWNIAVVSNPGIADLGGYCDVAVEYAWKANSLYLYTIKKGYVEMQGGRNNIYEDKLGTILRERFGHNMASEPPDYGDLFDGMFD